MEKKRYKDSQYFVCSDGRIWSESYGGMFCKSTDNGIGYMQHSYKVKGEKNKKLYIHRMVAECFVPNINGLKDVNHKNGIKSDNRAENLEWVTKRDNCVHAVENKLMKSGSDCSYSKLSREQVLEIRENLKIKVAALAAKFNVSDSTIYGVRNNKIYKKEYGW